MKINELTDTYQIMSIKQTADFLGVSRSTIYKWTDARILLSYRLGGKVLYRKSEVLKALIESKQK